MKDLNPKPTPEESRIACQILAYLNENPESQDTEEGAWWWVLDQEIKVNMASVRRSLAILRELGLLSESKGCDGKIHYRLDERQRERIQRILSTGRISSSS